MIPTVHSVEEAMEWFLSHSGGSVRCQRPDGSDLIVDCFPDAKAFFDGQA